MQTVCSREMEQNNDRREEARQRMPVMNTRAPSVTQYPAESNSELDSKTHRFPLGPLLEQKWTRENFRCILIESNHREARLLRVREQRSSSGCKSRRLSHRASDTGWTRLKVSGLDKRFTEKSANYRSLMTKPFDRRTRAKELLEGNYLAAPS